jgi:hypothetical protein
MSSAVALRNISENLGAEIQNKLNTAKNMLAERLTQNFMPTKFKELLTVRSKEGRLFNKIVTI